MAPCSLVPWCRTHRFQRWKRRATLSAVVLLVISVFGLSLSGGLEALALAAQHESSAKEVPLQAASPRIAAFCGFTVALVIVIPAATAGPAFTAPLGTALLLGQLALLSGRVGLLLCMLAAAVGLPLAHILLLIPSGIFQYALPGLVGPAAGLCTSQLLGGDEGLEICLTAIGLLALLHGVCLLRILKMGGW
eukprot:TRINITY_DN114730_c0_g1_i1.p1 TRINITY_DN114730_c0_g1~~TRINITY_DN114730_c0_g1_i1.p1  ORF type:complete len:206 (+),score=36.24 TRINITY_DN114730_c0_g1_i1:44-619(+)